MGNVPIPAYAKHLTFAALFVVAAVNFTRTTLNVIESSKRLDLLKNEVSSLDDEKKQLQEDLQYKMSDNFVEKEARNELGMAKNGEELFVVEDILGATSSKSGDAKKRQNWQLWVEVFSRGFDNIERF
jgi:cell division protein FtsB